MPIEIAESVLEAQQRLIETLNTHLGGKLVAAATSDYPLPAPEIYIELIYEANEPEKLLEVWRHQNVDEVAVWVAPRGPGQTLQDYSGDGTQYERVQQVPFLVAAMLKSPAGYDLPTVRGRTLTEREWLRRRGEKYKGAMIDALTESAIDAVAVHEVDITGHDAEVRAGVGEDEFGSFVAASIAADITQEVWISQ